jgi:hypothetical protein
VAYITAEARRELLRDVATSIVALGKALATLGVVYEALDEHTADTLESEVFRPVQLAYGRAQRTHAAFAARHGLQGRAFAAAAPGTATRSVRELLDAAVTDVIEADSNLVELQDSMRPVEVGDPELRAGLAEVRRLIGPVPDRAARLQGLVGR